MPFGFSVQKKLWIECGGKIGEYNSKLFKKFATKNGWYNSEKDGWSTYNEFMRDTNNAQNALLGSLPRTFGSGWVDWGEGEIFRDFFSLVETCKL